MTSDALIRDVARSTRSDVASGRTVALPEAGVRP